MSIGADRRQQSTTKINSVPEAVGQVNTREVDLDRRMQDLLQRVYGRNGSLENQKPPVKIIFLC